MKTFISNLKRAIQNRESVTIGGGQFSPDELRAVLSALENSRKTEKEMRDHAQGIATDFFFADDDEPWEPFEDWDFQQVQIERDNLAGAILHAMKWSQDNEN